MSLSSNPISLASQHINSWKPSSPHLVLASYNPCNIGTCFKSHHQQLSYLSLHTPFPHSPTILSIELPTYFLHPSQPTEQLYQQ